MVLHRLLRAQCRSCPQISTRHSLFGSHATSLIHNHFLPGFPVSMQKIVARQSGLNSLLTSSKTIAPTWNRSGISNAGKSVTEFLGNCNRLKWVPYHACEYRPVRRWTIDLEFVSNSKAELDAPPVGHSAIFVSNSPVGVIASAQNAGCCSLQERVHDTMLLRQSTDRSLQFLVVF